MKNYLMFAFFLSVVALMLVFNQGSQPVSGSVNVGQEYNATSTVGMGDNKFQLIRGVPTSVGSVVVASSSATTLKLWNATSTNDIASSSPAHFKASIGEGTYTFDSMFERGLIVELPSGFNGAYTITWR